MNGEYDNHSEPDDFYWNVEQQLTGDQEARAGITGYKYPAQDVGEQKALSHHSLSCDLTVGARWGRYVTLDFGGFNADPENVLADLDKTIEMLKLAREQFAKLMVEFPAQSWSPSNG